MYLQGATNGCCEPNLIGLPSGISKKKGFCAERDSDNLTDVTPCISASLQCHERAAQVWGGDMVCGVIQFKKP
jgi:hypothetical protein